ncbi:tricarboxylate transport protein B, mitochondrial-like [Diorhabda carinulata]|uniref:tricarboxylate transport protein B, mitochondrial-like n=1 Tax=Diorhabda carinulata TaxID=1163345 RepID=UPI0025A2456C|nr:tricarboxylate transport protein B, mitochondrial-like [Diorhabda carinulata]
MADPSSNKAFISPFKKPRYIDSAKPVSQYFYIQAILFSGIVTCIETLITYPTEYVKTQIQLDGRDNKRLYKGIFDCVNSTVQRHGVTGLYRGLSILLCGSIPKSVIRFGSYELYKEQLLQATGCYELNLAQTTLCGLAAGITEGLLIVTPVETIKVKFIEDQRLETFRYNKLVYGLGIIFKEQGIRGMYKGVAATVAKQGTSQATRFWVMNSCKNWYRSDDVEKPIPKYMIGIFGGLAGFVSVLVNNPLDVVKTRMQAIDAVKYKGILDCFIKTMINEGPLSFYKGTIPRSCRAISEVGITFIIYESIMQNLNSRQPRQL